MKQEDFHNEKPRYYATDFPEIKEKIPDEKRKLYLEYEQQHNGIAQKASDDIAATNENSGNPEEQPVTLKTCRPSPPTPSNKSPRADSTSRLPAPNAAAADAS